MARPLFHGIWWSKIKECICKID